MASGIIVFILTFFAAQFIISRYRRQLRHKEGMFTGLFLFHVLFFWIYYFYGKATASDSHYYYQKVVTNMRGENWLDFYSVGTPFIEFVGYPFIKFFGLSYEGVMLIFAFLGFLGFFFFYLFIVEKVEFRHKFFGMDFIALLLFLPNMHFWTVSFGKGSIIFFGLGLFFYGLNNYSKRWLAVALGVLVIYHVRAHVMLVILIALLLSALFSYKGLSIFQKALIIAVSIAAISPVLETFMQYARIEDTTIETYESFTQHRSSELAKATSGIEISSYNQLQKVFSFLFRPLFFDAPGAMGFIVSFENLLYLILFLKLISLRFIRYLLQSDWMVKLSFFIFIMISVAFAQVSGNLGIAIRQKSMIMYLLFFVLMSYADYAFNRYGKRVI